MSSTAGAGSHGNSTAHLSTNAGRFHHILTAAAATGGGEKVANGQYEYESILTVLLPMVPPHLKDTLYCESEAGLE